MNEVEPVLTDNSQNMDNGVESSYQNEPLGIPNKAQLKNKDILELFKTQSFQSGLSKGKENFPCVNWCVNDQLTLRTKINRTVEKIKTLKRNNKSKLQIFLEEPFYFPEQRPIPTSTVKKLEKENEKVVKENRQLKRQLKEQNFEFDNLDLQIDHYERKCNILLKLLSVTGDKYKETSKEKWNLKRESRAWEKKYDVISLELDNALETLNELKEKVSSLGPKNVSRKIKRRDEKIEKLQNENEEKTKEIENLNKECEKNSKTIGGLQKDKRRLLVKVCRMSKMPDKITNDNVTEIQKLKNEISEKQQQILELEHLNDILSDDTIASFHDGKFTNEVRETIMTLLTECGVSQNKVNDVISVVLKNLAGKKLSRLPSTGVKSRLLIEAKRVAQKQIVDSMLQYENDFPDDLENFVGFTGNCLHQDATSKFHKHFQSFQITTPGKKTMFVGLQEVGSGEASSVMASFKQIIEDMGNAVHNQPEIVSRLVCSIVSTMSDQGAVNPVFNKQLVELKANLLPNIVNTWDTLSSETQSEMANISSFFCKMHIFVNMATEVDKCLAIFEGNVCNGKNPFAFEWKESGSSRLTRTVSKALTLHGCEKSGVGQHFLVHLKERGIKNELITFRGHRFNHLFYAAGATYHHLSEITDFLDSWADPNELLKSITFDVKEKAFISGIRALGIIDKFITGPFWRIIESSKNILELTPTLCTLKEKLQELSNDASSLLAGDMIFEGVDVHKDDIYESLIQNTDDPVIEMYTQMALELCLGGMLLILERQPKDQLPGGRFNEPSPSVQMHGSSVPATNTCSERDFAQLDMLVRLKPSASTIAYESIIMWSNNKTSKWLNDLTEKEKQSVIDDARVSAPKMMESFKTRQQQLFNKKLEILRAKKEKKANKENKEYNQKVVLTAKLNGLGGLWISIEQIQAYKEKVNQNQNKNTLLKEALITQLQFRKQVLKSKGPKEKFQQSSKGQQYSLLKLEQNLIEIIDLNKENETVDTSENKLNYFSEDEVRVKIALAKQTLSKRLLDERRKITVSQQTHLLPKYIENPELLVGTKFKHKRKEEGSNEVEWCSGRVVSILKLNGKKTEYNVIYDIDPENEWHFPLLIDMSQSNFIIEI